MTQPNPTTALARIEPSNMDELQVFAKNAHDSGFFGVKNQQQALILAMSGHDLGLSFTQALRAFHIINGRPAMSAEGMVAICLGRRDVCEYFVTLDSSSERCTVETKRSGSPAPQRLTFTMEDAKRAGLTGGNWTKFPAAMLRARAKSALARDAYPDLLMGLYEEDEVRHMEPREIPAQAAPAPTAPRPAPEVVDAEVVPAPAPKPAPKPRTLADLGLAAEDVDGWLLSLGKPLSGERDPAGMSALVTNLAPGKPARAQFDGWMQEKAAEEAERAAIEGEPRAEAK